MDDRLLLGTGSRDSEIPSVHNLEESQVRGGHDLLTPLAAPCASSDPSRDREAVGATQNDSAQSGLPKRKRVFDLLFCVSAMPVWVPLVIVGMLAVLCGAGFPALYVSPRVVYRGHTARIAKLRTMVADAATIANRSTIPVTGQRFLNIGLESPLYTPVGRVIEKLCLTELPQFAHVLTGTMSVIGNRPLPVDVLGALTEAHPEAADRFLTRAGLTGPVQLVGRDNISDADRLAVEIAYCRLCTRRYSMYLDLMIAIHTVLVLARLRPPFTPAEIASQMDEWARA